MGQASDDAAARAMVAELNGPAALTAKAQAADGQSAAVSEEFALAAMTAALSTIPTGEQQSRPREAIPHTLPGRNATEMTPGDSDPRETPEIIEPTPMPTNAFSNMRRTPPPSEEFESAPAAPAVKPLPGLLLFTGSPKVGKKWLAQELDALAFSPNNLLADAVYRVFGPVHVGPKFLDLVKAWALGIVDERYAMTPLRFNTVLQMRHILSAAMDGQVAFSFGHPDFFKKYLEITRASMPEDRRIVILDIDDEDYYNYFTTLGAAAYHVVCASITRKARGGNENAGTKFVGDLNKSASANAGRPGGKLRVIWNDEVDRPSDRLYSVDELIAKAQAKPVKNASVSEEV